MCQAPNLSTKGFATRSYLDLFAAPGRLAFCAAGLIARSGGAMVGVGIVLMVSSLYGSYAWAGAISAANGLAWAVGNAVLSHLVDRYGQRRVMIPAAIVTAVSLAGLIVSAWCHLPVWWLLVPSIISGATGGSAGAMVRARWNHALNGGPQLQAAFALESTLDEVTYVVGPLVATVLATTVHPTAGLVAPVLLTLTGGLWFYQGLRASQPPVGARVAAEQAGMPASGAASKPVAGLRPDRLILAFGGVVSVLIVALLFGGTFGAVDITVVAGTTAMGHRSLAGVVLAAISLGSAIAGLTYGARVWKASLPRRFAIGVAAYGVLMALYLIAHSVPLLAMVGFLTGLAIAPTFTNANTLISALVPKHRLTEGLAWIGTAIGFGASLGSSVAGRLIDSFGYQSGFVGTTAVALLASVLALAGVRTISRHVAGAG